MKRRILSVLVALALCLGLAPGTARAWVVNSNGTYVYNGQTRKVQSFQLTLDGVRVLKSGVDFEITKYTDLDGNEIDCIDVGPVLMHMHTDDNTIGALNNGQIRYDIVPAPLTITGLGGSHTKEYDGNEDCDGSGLEIQFDGKFNGDDVAIRPVDETYTYGGPNVGAGKEITLNCASYELAGTKAGNYYIADDAPKTLTASAGTITKGSYTGKKTDSSEARYGTRGSFDLSNLLPDGYTLGQIATEDGNSIFSGTPTVNGSVLTYQLVDNHQKVGKTGNIIVPVSCANYKDFSLTITVTVLNKLVPELTVTPITHVYNGRAPELPEMTAAVNGKKVRGRFEIQGELPVDVTDGTTLSVKFTPDDKETYAEARGDLSVTICPAQITVKADDQSARKGGPMPPLTWTVTGLAEGASLKTAPTLTCSGDTSTVGTYPITPAGAQVPDGGNYVEDITYVPGTLTITDPVVPVTGVSLDKASLSLFAGASERLTAAVSPGSATNKAVVWTSSDPAVAAVDASGTVTAVSPGSAVITAATADGGLTAVCTVTVKETTILPDPPAGDGGTRFQLVMEPGISGVPAGLRGIEALDTPAKLETAMRTEITKAAPGVPQANTAVYDVALLVSTDGGRTWVPATRDNFPAGGLTITLPYPEGTNSSYRFTVVHMFTTSDFGRQPGETEVFTPGQVRNTASGIQATLTGLSPVSVGWTAPAAPPDEPSYGGGDVGESGGTAPAVPQKPAPKPETPSQPVPDPPERPCDGGAACPSRRFTDLEVPGAWYHEAVDYALESGLMAGTGSGIFGPEGRLTRGQLAQILYNLAGRPAVTASSPFIDVAPGAWYAPAVTWAAERGVVDGYGSGLFGPDGNITREQLAVMLWRYAGRPEPAGRELTFGDAGQISGYARDALCWAVEAGVVKGTGGGILDPGGPATRAQAAQMLKNYLER